jgi:hypothetical protein
MTTDLHAVEFGERNNAVSVRKVKGIALGVQNFPFQGVLRFNQVVFTGESCSILGFAKVRRTYGRSDQNAGAIRNGAKRSWHCGRLAGSRFDQILLHSRSSGTKSQIEHH